MGQPQSKPEEQDPVNWGDVVKTSWSGKTSLPIASAMEQEQSKPKEKITSSCGIISRATDLTLHSASGTTKLTTNHNLQVRTGRRGVYIGAALPRKRVQVEYKKDVEKLENKQGEIHCKEFYKIQSKHRLGRKDERVKVPIWISNSDSDIKPRIQGILFKPLHESWKPHLDNAIKDINDAAPGLNLDIASDRSSAKVIVFGTTGRSNAFTRGNIDPNATGQALICLSDYWSLKKRTSCHELLHALFVQHEQRRSDGNKYLDYNMDGYQVVPDSDIVGITRFDPFSIMLYHEGNNTFTRKAEADPVWKLKRSTAPNMEMSELDKVGLNIIFRPCKGPNYSPKIGPNGLWYCGRQGATEKHNRPAKRATDGKCGPNYPNCPACRVLANPTLEKIWAEDKWQGWSGFVYCGKWFGVQEPGHDGYCGPNNGNACTDCMKYM